MDSFYSIIRSLCSCFNNDTLKNEPELKLEKSELKISDESCKKVKEAIYKSSDIQKYVDGTEPVTIQTLLNILKNKTINQYFFKSDAFDKNKICEPLKKIKEYCGYEAKNGEERVNSFLKSLDKTNFSSILSDAFSNFCTGKSKKAQLYFDTFVKRLNFIAGYLGDVIKKYGDKYYVESSGSDLHKNGEHVLYLINKKTGKKEKVYKPHDLKIDKAIIGQNIYFKDEKTNNYDKIYEKYSLKDEEYTKKKQEEYSEKLKSTNDNDSEKRQEYEEKSKKNYRSPSASILEKLNKKLINESRDLYKNENNGEDKYGSDKYDYNKYGIPFLTMKIEDDHLEEYIQDLKEKSVPENEDEQKKYFYKLGMLDVISQAMAIIDLNHQNLVRNGNNPRIIDAEFGFLQYFGSQGSNSVCKNSKGIVLMLNEIQNKFVDNYNSYLAGFKFMYDKIRNENMKNSLLKKVGKLLGPVNTK